MGDDNKPQRRTLRTYYHAVPEFLRPNIQGGRGFETGTDKALSHMPLSLKDIPPILLVKPSDFGTVSPPMFRLGYPVTKEALERFSDWYKLDSIAPRERNMNVQNSAGSRKLYRQSTINAFEKDRDTSEFDDLARILDFLRELNFKTLQPSYGSVLVGPCQPIYNQLPDPQPIFSAVCSEESNATPTECDGPLASPSTVTADPLCEIPEYKICPFISVATSYCDASELPDEKELTAFQALWNGFWYEAKDALPRWYPDYVWGCWRERANDSDKSGGRPRR